MGIPSDTTANSSSDDLVQLSDIRGKTFTEAEKTLKNLGFTVKSVTGKDKNSTTVSDQVPKPGVSLQKNSVIVLYDDSNTTRTSVTVPDLTSMSAYQATNTLRNLNLNVSIDGNGTVTSQDPPVNSQVEEGTVVKIYLKSSSSSAH